MFSEIIVGWVDSESADAALDWAAGRAGSTPVRIVTVVRGRETGSDYLSATSPESQARVRLIEAADRVRSRFPNGHFDTEVVRGSVIDELTRLGAPETLVVLGSTPRSQRDREFGWSIATRVAGAHEPGTVAVVPRGFSAAGRTGVVVGLDASPSAADVLGIAVDEALALSQDLQVVHAWTAPPYWQDAYVPDLDSEFSLREVHEGILAGGVARAAETTQLTVRGNLLQGPPDVALTEAARGALELVIGNHGNRGLARFLLGSVSHSVLRDLPAPTIVVRS